MLLLLNLQAYTQSESEKFPITETAPLPDLISESYKELARIRISEMDKTRVTKHDKAFQLSVNYSLSNLLKSGEIYLNSELNKYLQEISDYLLRDHASKNMVRLYATRFYEVNAFSIGEGSLMVFIGLLARVENEAQLAFIIGHEITHYLENHSFEKYRSHKQLRKDISSSTESRVKRLKNLMKYSRENELVADANGFKLLEKSVYSADESTKALALLEYTQQDIYSDSLDFLSIFNSEEMPLDSLFTVISKKKKINYAKKNRKSRVSNSTVSINDENKEGSESDGEDDFDSHPDVKSRIEVIEKKLKESNSKGTEKFFLGEERFLKMRRIARIELINSLMESGYYSRSLYQSLQMAQLEPSNSYVAGTSVISLYWLAKMSLNREKSTGLSTIKSVSQPSYEPLYYLITKLKSKEFLKMSIAYTNKLLIKFPGDEEILIHKAKLIELSDKQLSIKSFSDYLSQYPKGKHSIYASYKIKSSQHVK